LFSFPIAPLSLRFRRSRVRSRAWQLRAALRRKERELAELAAQLSATQARRAESRTPRAVRRRERVRGAASQRGTL
jgi:hypothetical protein